MFGFLKRIHRARKAERQLSEAQDAALFEPLGLRRGGFVTVDPTRYRLQADAYVFAAPEGSQRIDARGLVDLGAASELHRFYLTDDAFVQVNTTAKAIDDIKLFVFDETRTPSNHASFEQWLGEESLIGRQTVEHRGRTFVRVWGDEGQSKVPPVAFDESVYTESDTVPAYTVNHYCMLYERPVDDTQRMEYLLISAEQTGDEYCVVFSVGVDISEADLEIA